MNIQETLDADPNKGWQRYLTTINRQVERDPDSFSDGLLIGENTALQCLGLDLTEADVIIGALRSIPEDSYTTAIALGAVHGAITERQRQSTLAPNL